MRSQSISFQIVSEFIDIFVKFSYFISQWWGFLTLCSVPRRGFLYTLTFFGAFAPFKSCHGVCPGGMVLDETDTCIRNVLPEVVVAVFVVGCLKVSESLVCDVLQLSMNKSVFLQLTYGLLSGGL